MRLATKLGVSLLRTTPLPSRSSANSLQAVDDGRVGLLAGDELEQVHVARREEEVACPGSGASPRRAAPPPWR